MLSVMSHTSQSTKDLSSSENLDLLVGKDLTPPNTANLTKSQTSDLPDPSVRAFLIRASVIRTNKKYVHFIRHAEGAHNIAMRDARTRFGKDSLEYNSLLSDATLLDSQITELGTLQCSNLRERLIRDTNILETAQLIVVSTMRRTIETALNSFPSLVGRIPIIALESIRETLGAALFNKRRTISVQQKDFPMVDFSHATDEDDVVWSRHSTSEDPVNKIEEKADRICRGREFCKWLSKRPESDIIVVTHSVFLFDLLDSVLRIDEDEAAKESFHHEKLFNYCEMKSFCLSLDDN